MYNKKIDLEILWRKEKKKEIDDKTFKTLYNLKYTHTIEICI